MPEARIKRGLLLNSLYVRPQCCDTAGCGDHVTAGSLQVILKTKQRLLFHISGFFFCYFKHSSCVFVSSCADSLMAVTPGVNQQSKWLSAANLWLGPRGVEGLWCLRLLLF